MLFTDEIVFLLARCLNRLELAQASLLYLIASFALSERDFGPRAPGLRIAHVVPVVFVFLSVINPVGF